MTEHIDYEFYRFKYLSGKGEVLDENSFDYYIRKAINILKRYAPSLSAEALTYEAKLCACEIAEIVFQNDATQSERGGVSSEKVGDWSKSYENTEQTMQAMQKKIKGVVYDYLSGTGLLYRGVYHDEKC